MTGTKSEKNIMLLCIILAAAVIALAAVIYGSIKGYDNFHKVSRLDSFEQNSNGGGEAVFDGVKHRFILDLPETVQGAPLVIMLHGYGESAEGFRLKTAFEKDANALGYAVAYVTGAPDPMSSTSASGWNSRIGISGNDDVGFLCAFAETLCENYKLDSTRVFAVGFSNGAFMTHRLAMEADDTFAAVVSVAGMMPESVWENKADKLNTGVFQITGEKDAVVPKNSDGSAETSVAPAMEDVLDYYIEMNHATQSETIVAGRNSVLEKHFSADSQKQVWSLFIPDGRHSWPDEKITGFSTNQIILDFLESQ